MRSQSEANPSTSRDLAEQAVLPQANINQSDAGPPIEDNNTGSPLASSPDRELTREEIQMKINEYGTKIRDYECSRRGKTAKQKQKACIDNSLKAHQKMVSHYQQRILDRMSLMTEQCNTKGYVIGTVTKTNKPMIGTSDSLRAWWKEQVMFDKAAPAQIDLYKKENSMEENLAEGSDTKSTTELLMELFDPTLGSIMSLLMQHCDPPQRMFPYEKEVPPPWWPTAQEDWWGQTGISTNEGPPPFKKPHGLKKKWKVAVLVGIVKSMSPDFWKPYSLVDHSSYLQSHMNAQEKKVWTLAMVTEAKLYCREYPNMPLDKAVSFLHAFGVMHLPHLTTGSSTTSTWPITEPPVGLPQQSIQRPPNPQLGLGGSFAPWYSSGAFSYNPMLYANVPSNVEHNNQIGGSGAASGAVQYHHAPALAHQIFDEQPGGVSTDGDTGFEYEQSGNERSTSGN
jgi:Ethylene insensitive 3